MFILEYGIIYVLYACRCFRTRVSGSTVGYNLVDRNLILKMKGVIDSDKN